YEDIYYWDIGFIHVWDNQANDFGDGRIEKLFGSLPRGVSIGNPVFSKNSPYIIAFDYFEEEEENYAILGANILTGDIDVIFNNTTLGYPSFSKNDDKIAFSGFNTWGNEIIGVVKLAENKISASGEDAIVLVNEAKWPVYYSTGTRQLGLAPVANFTADYKSGSAPFEVQFIDLSLNNPVNWLWDLNGGDPTYSDEQNPLITYHTPGTYRVSLTVSNNFGDNTIRKEAYVSVYPTAVDAPKKANLAVYPNPVDAVVTIPCNGNFSARITDLNGKELMRQNNRQHWDLTGLKPGIYFMEVQSEEDLLRQRFVKK
ncbi:MAG TPA: PKD domain-containing protein, partial [Prolixibacteraceae bacterium]|nr:PKD domain-containing protein [Prolixibacteraceae bacterium]